MCLKLFFRHFGKPSAPAVIPGQEAAESKNGCDWGSSVVVPSMREAPGSNPSIAKKKKERKDQ